MKYFLALFIVFFLNPFSGFSQTAEELQKMAMQKMDSGNFHDASALIDKAISLYPGNGDLYLGKAQIDFQLHNVRGTMESVYKAISLNPNKSEPYNEAGNYYNSFGLNDSAIAMFNRALKYAPNDTIYYSIIGNRSGAHLHKQDYKAARKDIELSLKRFPDHIGNLNNAAIINWYLKNSEQTFIYLHKAAAIDSTFSGTFINLGLYYTESGKYDLALNNFNHALKLEPEMPLLYSNRGYLYYKMGENSQALKDINKSLNDYPTNSYAYRNRALVYLAMNKKKEACRDLEAALYHGFTQTYGKEVKELSKKNCK